MIRIKFELLPKLGRYNPNNVHMADTHTNGL